LGGLSLFPNPASKSITLNIENYNGPVQIKVYDLQGKMLIASNLSVTNSNVNLNISSLNSGLYLVRVTNKDGERVVKLVVE
jgi:hypothetical protein